MSKLALNQQLWNAVVDNDPGMVEAALVAGADPDFHHATDPTRGTTQAHWPWSVLHEAISLGRNEAVLLLLQHGVEQTNDGVFGLTPIHMAALLGHESLIDALIQQGGDALARTYSGDTALMMALTNQDHDEQPIAAKISDPGLALRIARRLLDAGCPINETNDEAFGANALWKAVGYQDAATVAELIRWGADPKHTLNAACPTSLITECGDAIHRAATGEHLGWFPEECRNEKRRAVEVLRVLHDAGVELPRASDSQQMTYHYPSHGVQLEIEAWWKAWDKTPTTGGEGGVHTSKGNEGPGRAAPKR